MRALHIGVLLAAVVISAFQAKAADKVNMVEDRALLSRMSKSAIRSSPKLILAP
jgi:hypothetical protein